MVLNRSGGVSFSFSRSTHILKLLRLENTGLWLASPQRKGTCGSVNVAELQSSVSHTISHAGWEDLENHRIPTLVSDRSSIIFTATNFWIGINSNYSTVVFAYKQSHDQLSLHLPCYLSLSEKLCWFFLKHHCGRKGVLVYGGKNMWRSLVAPFVMNPFY